MEKDLQTEVYQKIQELAFAIDIDGTITQSHKEIQGASQTLNLLDSLKIPYVLLTNNIGKSQQAKAQETNKLLKLDTPISKQQVIINTTPLRQHINFQQNTVLLVGRKLLFDQILPLESIKRYITVDEYCTIFPESVPLSRREKDQRYFATKKIIQQRLNIFDISKQKLKIDAIVISTSPSTWEQCYQVIIDLLNSNDGSVGQQKNQYRYCEKHIPVLATYNDLFYAVKEHPLPRILIQGFNLGLKTLFKQIYGHELNLILYGKPQVSTYQFTQRHINKYFKPCKKFVMIGDNQNSDILGAYNSKWDSILVKTGVTKHDSIMATVNSPNIKQGVLKYLQRYRRDKVN